MKKIISIILVIFSISGFSQTNLELEVFNLVNKYRIKNNLDSLIWDSIAYKVAQHHVDYMRLSGKITHFEDISDTLVSKVIVNFGMRFAVEGLKNGTNVYENCAMINLEFYPSLSVASCVLDCWINSPEHNAILLDNKLKYVGIANKFGTFYKEIDAFDQQGNIYYVNLENLKLEWFSLNGYDKK